jgi:hypothetical protein
LPPSGTTTTTAGFTQPALNATVNVPVTSSSLIVAAQTVWIQGGGYYAVSSIPDSTHVTVLNAYYQANVAATTTVASGALVVSGGLPSRQTQTDASDQHVYSFQDGSAATPWNDSGGVGGWGALTVKAGNPLAANTITIADGLFGTAPDNGILYTQANIPMLYGAEGASTELTPPFTVSCWFLQRVNSGANPQVIMGRSDEAGVGVGTLFSVALVMAGQTLGAILTIAGSQKNLGVATSTPFPQNQWHHVGTAYDATTWTLYWDGNLVATVAQTGSISWIANNGWSFLGAYGHGWTGTFEQSLGSIQDARFDNVIRTPSWFLNVYQRGVGQF